MAARALTGLLALVGAAALFGACADPVHDQQVTALGPEVSGVPQGEFHRAGQPCAVCHGVEGPAKTRFSIAGTVFWGPNQTVGAEGVTIDMIDSLGSSPPSGTVVTNCVGNFFVTPDVWDPAFPIFVQVQSGTTTSKMHSQISREPSCGNCHKDPVNFDTPGHIHALSTDPANPFIDQNCPVNPTIARASGVP
jgi:hypothetical protein